MPGAFLLLLGRKSHICCLLGEAAFVSRATCLGHITGYEVSMLHGPCVHGVGALRMI
jgi:hypothetical protein